MVGMGLPEFEGLVLLMVGLCFGAVVTTSSTVRRLGPLRLTLLLAVAEAVSTVLAYWVWIFFIVQWE